MCLQASSLLLPRGEASEAAADQAMASNAEGGGGGDDSGAKFCSLHPEVKVRRKDGLFKTTHIGCYKCKLGKVIHSHTCFIRNVKGSGGYGEVVHVY